MPETYKIRLLLALLLAASMWFYVQHVLIAHQQAEAARYDIPRGNLSDLYPRWLGARELLLHHRDPYSVEVTREIQAGYYGRPLDPAKPYDPKDQQGFAYPVYISFLLAPTIQLPFSVVQTGFRWFLVGLTAMSVLLWLRALGWRVSPQATAILIVLTLGSFPVLQGIKLQQLTLLVSGLLAFCALLLVEGHLATAGVLLALATIKPQLALLPCAWLLLWACTDWQRRQRLVWGFAGTMAAFFAGSQLLLHGWIGRFRDAIVAYQQYNDGAGSVLDVLLTPAWGKIAAAFTLLTLAALAWRSRQANHNSVTFNFILVAVLAVTVVVIPKAAPYNQILLLPALMFVIQHRDGLWEKNLLVRASVLLAALVLVWPWLATLVLTGAALFLPTESIQQAWAVPIYPSFATPVVVLLLLACGLREGTRAQLPS